MHIYLSRKVPIDAILASAAIPGVFPSVSWGNRALVDGGIVNNTPISHAVELGADRIIVLPVITRHRLGRAPRGAIGAGLAAVSRAIAWRFAQDVVRYSDSAELTVLPTPDAEDIMPTDFSRAYELIADGFSLARSALTRLRQPLTLAHAA